MFIELPIKCMFYIITALKTMDETFFYAVQNVFVCVC